MFKIIKIYIYIYSKLLLVGIITSLEIPSFKSPLAFELHITFVRTNFAFISNNLLT